MTTKTKQSLVRAEAIRLCFGPQFEAERWHLLGDLAGRNLPSAVDLERLHELLCFARAWPDSPRVLHLARAELQRFERRSDLERFRSRLRDSGIAGTELRYRFFHPTARWLTRKWPAHVQVDWAEFDNQDALLDVTSGMGVFAERQGLSSLFSQGQEVRDLIDAMRGPAETDATFLLGAFDELAVSERSREKQYDALELPLLLSPGEATPSRTTAELRTEEIHHHPEALSRSRTRSRGRLDLAGGDSVRLGRLTRRRANQVIDLARGALTVRLRDLDPIAYADSRDVQLADCGQGFEIAVMGVIPERRFLLECEHGFLLLKNGVPIGYGCTWALFGSCQLNFNLFPTFRGSQAAWLYGRVCALFLQMYGCDTLVVEPYQLGDENEEAIESGAWWFYAKLGYRPRQADALRLARAELAKKRRQKGYRTPRRALRRLALSSMFLDLGNKRRDVLGELETDAVGLAVADHMARHYGSQRRRGERECRLRVAEWLKIDEASLSRGQRLWLRRWSPLLVALDEIASWPVRARADLRDVILAKGDIDQARYVRLFDRHLLLRRGLVRLMRT